MHAITWHPVNGLYLVLLTFCCAVSGAAQTARTWDAAGGAWSENGNWDPPGPLVGGDSVTFGTTGSGGANTNDIGPLSLGPFTVTEGDHTMDLDGHALTLTTFAVEGWGADKTGTLSLVNGSIDALGALNIGRGADAHAHVTLAADAGLTIGSESSRAVLRVRDGNATVAGTKASLTSSGAFNAWLTDLEVGARATGYVTGDQYGLLDLSGVTEAGVLDISGNVRIGDGTYAMGDVLISDAIVFKMGSPSARGGNLHLARNRSDHALTDPLQHLALGTNRFEAYVASLRVGDANGLNQRAKGKLDASKVTEGILDVAGDFIVGHQAAASLNAQGIVLISDGIDVKIGDPVAGRGQLIVGRCLGGFEDSLLELGSGRFAAYITNLVVGNTAQTTYAARNNEINAGDVTEGVLDLIGPFWVGRGVSVDRANRVALSDNFVATLGTDAQRSSMAVADAARPGSASVAAGGSFSAYLSSLTVGRNTHASASTANGLLDLSSVTNGCLNVSGSIVIGSGVAGVGEVRLPPIPAAAGDLLIGSTIANSKGTLVMTGTVMIVTNSVVLDGPSAANKARVQTTLTGTSGGLDLGPDASLTVNQGVIDITFAEPPSDSTQSYWGLRWVGDRVSELNTLEQNGKLTWNDNALPKKAGIHYNGTFTFVGVPPPSGTVFLFR